MSDHQITPSNDELLRNIALVITAVANGDFSQKVTVEATGEMLELKKTINTMVDQLQVFAAEAMRIAREAGTEGKFGGQMEVEGVTGAWKDLTVGINVMSGNLTDQIRFLHTNVQAAIQGDPAKRPGPEMQGEMANLRDGLNILIERSASS
jgi:HAMP domain-containing protein